MAEPEGWLYDVSDNAAGVQFDGRLGETAIERFNRLNVIAKSRPMSEKERRILDAAYTEAKEEHRRLQLVTPPPKPAPPVKAIPRKPVETMPTTGDSATAQGAPAIREEDSPDDKSVEVSRTAPGTVPRSRAGDLTCQAQAPKSSAEAAACVEPPPVSEGDRASLESAIDHNAQTVEGENHPTHGAPFSRTPASVADPVDLFTGTFTLSVVDLVVPGAGSDIAFERCYRSGQPYFGPFGYGWDHTFNLYLRRLSDGRIALWTGRLREQYFLPAGAATWQCEPSLAAVIEPLPTPEDGFEVRHPQGVVWRFERPPGWSHPENIPLVAIVDRHGNSLRLSFGDDSRLESVFDDTERGLIFSYGSCGLLEQVSDHTNTRVVRYEHHPESEHLVRVVLPATAAFPEGLATRYEYDLFADHPAMRHNILRVIDSSDRIYVENDYAGPEAGWAFNTVVAQRVGTDEFEFEYEQIQWVAAIDEFVNDIATRTAVRRPDGTLEFYTFNFRGDVLDHRFRLNADGSFRVVASQWSYDPQGNVIKAVAPDGVRTVFTYDTGNLDPRARRNLLQTELFAALPGGVPNRVVERSDYEPSFQLRTRVVDEAGAETHFLYDFDLGAPNGTGLLKRIIQPSVTLPDGAIQAARFDLEHNVRGQVTAIESPDGVRTELSYEVAGPHKGFLRRVVRDVAGLANITELGYGPTGFPLFVIEPGGARTDAVVNGSGQVEAVILPEVDGARVSIRQILGETGVPLRTELPRGAYAEQGLSDTFILDELETDVLGRVVGAHTAANTRRARRSRLVLDYAGRPVASLDPRGTWTTLRYDERGQLLRRVSAAGEPEETAETCGYDRAGRFEWASDAAGRTERVELRDAWGRPVRVRRASGAVDEFVWGARDLLLERRVVGRPGPDEPIRLLAREAFGYDKRARLTTHTQWAFADDPTTATPLSTRVVLDPNDQPVCLLLPRGGEITLTYDGLGRMTGSTDVYGNASELAYDAAGNLAKVIHHDRFGADLRSRQFIYDHDARRRMVRATAPDRVTEYDYDERGVMTERRESGNVTTRFRSGPHAELDEILFDPGGLQLRSLHTYDACGDALTYSDPSGETTRWVRDRLGRVVRAELPDSTTWTREYDRGGRIRSTGSPSGVSTYFAYGMHTDQPLRVSVAVPPGKRGAGPYEFQYDDLERLVHATGPLGDILRRYDSLDRLREESSLGETLGFVRDDVTGTSDLIYPDGRRERVTYDAGGRPTNTTLVASGALGGTPGQALWDVVYGGVDHPVRITHGNGVAADFIHDDAARLIALTFSRNNNLIDGVRVAHDERARSALVQHLSPVDTTLHRFDRRDRLIEARSGLALPVIGPHVSPVDQEAVVSSARSAAAQRSEVYDLDRADSRRSRTRTGPGGGTEMYTTLPGHRLSMAGSNPITHHADGPRSRDRRFAYEIDAFDRIVEVRDATSNALVAEFKYDALSRPAVSMAAGLDVRRWFLGAQPIEQRSGAGAIPVRQWTPHPLAPTPIRTGDATGQSFIHFDGGLSSLCTTDDAGAVIEKHRYGPFGELQNLSIGGGVAQPPVDGAWWRGMPWLAELGLFHTPRRLYDPDTGVFLARDPHLYADSPSPYAFAAHNPVDFADPEGRDKKPLNEDGASSGNRLERPPGVRDDDWFRRWDAIPGRSADSPPLIHRPWGVGGAGFGLRYGSPPRFTLLVPDTYDKVKMDAYHRAVLQGRIGRNAGSEARTETRRNSPQQRAARRDFWNWQRARTWLPLLSPQWNPLQPDHIIELQHDRWGTSGDHWTDYRAQDGPLNEAEGRASWRLQRNNPFQKPAGAVVKESQGGRWYNSIRVRQTSYAIGTLMEAYGIYESGAHVRDAANADLREGTMGEQALQAIAEEAGGWATAIAMGTEFATLGAVCGPAAWFCMPLGGLIGGGVGYWSGSRAVGVVTGVGKAGIDQAFK